MGPYKKLIIIPVLLLGMYFNASSQQLAADVQHYSISLTLSDKTDRIIGVTAVKVRFPEDAKVFHLDLVGQGKKDTGMAVTAVTEGKLPISFRQDSTGIQLSIRVRQGETHTYTITYSGIPKDGLIISTSKFGRRTFFSDNWPNRAHYWIPCVDHPSDKAGVDFNIIAPDHYTVIANGLKTAETPLPGHLKRTRYAEKVVLPTKVIAVGVADFAVEESANVAGIPVYSYVFPENKEQGFRDYKTAGEILQFFIQQIGPFPYKKLANIQSKTIYGGMENASAIFYSEESVGSKHIEELLAHEIAHQWFGDAITEKDWEHVWLSEGFATYMTHVYMEHKYGVDTLMAGLKADRKKIISFAVRRRTPVVDTTANGEYTQLLNANSYQKGAWVLHMLRRQLTDTIFWQGIREYFTAYGGHNANTSDFRKVMEKVSGQDLTAFFQQWLYTPGMPELSTIPWPGAEGKDVIIRVKQLQEPLFAFPLEYSVNKGATVQKANIMSKETAIIAPVSSDTPHVLIDPQVNLLYRER